MQIARSNLQQASTVRLEAARANSVQADIGFEQAQRNYERSQRLAQAGDPEFTSLVGNSGSGKSTLHGSCYRPKKRGEKQERQEIDFLSFRSFKCLMTR